jgi:hypothetical protein
MRYKKNEKGCAKKKEQKARAVCGGWVVVVE